MWHRFTTSKHDHTNYCYPSKQDPLFSLLSSALVDFIKYQLVSYAILKKKHILFSESFLFHFCKVV